MFSGREIPTEKITTTTTMENLFLQIFERKRWIVEQVKQQIDLYDQHLASKCILDGVTPPPWLWSPYCPSQTSELNKEEIISGLMFPQSRPSNIYASSSRFSYQQPVNFLVDNVKTLELNQPLEKQLLEEDHRHPNIASARDFQEERIPESASTRCEQNVNGLFPEYSQNNRVEKSAVASSLDLVTSTGYSQGERVPKSISTTGCEQEPGLSSPRYCPDGAETNTCVDPALSLARVQRSKSRQRAFELRSSAKASKSHSKSNNDLQASPTENLGFEIASLRSDNVNEVEVFENEEEGCREEAVENSNSQGKEGDQGIKFSSTPKSNRPCQKVDSVRKSSSADKYTSVAPDSGGPNSLFDTGLVKEMALSQPTNTANEVCAKEEGKVIDSQGKRCSDIIYLDRVTRSKSLTEEFSCKNEHSKLSNSCSGEFLSRSLNASPRAGHKIELPFSTSMNNDAFVRTEAGTSNSQSQNVYSGRATRSRSTAQECRSKTEHSGNVDSSSVDLQSRHSVALLQCDDERKLWKPTTDSGEGFLVEEDNTDVKQCKEKGESIDPSTISRSKSLSQADVLVDEPPEVGRIQDCRSKTEHSDYAESSSVELQSRNSVVVLQSDEERELSKPSTVSEKGLLVEEDHTGDKQCKEKDESILTSRISRSRSSSQAEISVDDPAVADESVLEENGAVPGDLVEHSTCDVSCRAKVAQRHSSWTNAESSQHHGTISRSRSSSRREELANKYEDPSIRSERELIAEQLDVRAVNSPSSTVNNLSASVKVEPLHFDDNDEQNFNQMRMNCQEESTERDAPISVAAAAKEIDVSFSAELEVNILLDNNSSATEEHDGLEKELVPAWKSPIGDADIKAGESEPPEPNVGLSVNNISNVHLDALTNSLKRRFSPSVSNHLSGNSVEFQAPGKSSLSEMSKEPLLSCLSNLSASGESKVSVEEDICQLDITKHAISASNKRSDEKTIAEDCEGEMKVDLSVVELKQSGNSYLCSAEPEKYSAALCNEFSDDSLQQQTTQPPHWLETSSGIGCPRTDRNIACTEANEFQAPESSVQAFCHSTPSMESSHLQNKRRRTLDKLSQGMPSSASLADALDPGSVRGNLGTVDRSVECLSLNHYDVELQKMIGSASSIELRLEEGYLLKGAGFKSPAARTFKAGHLSGLGSLTIPNQSENTEIVPCAQESSHLLDGRIARDSIGSPDVLPVGLIGSDDDSLPVLEGFIIQTDDENQSGSRDQINLDSLQFPKTTVERASVLEQICRSACMSTPSLHLSTSFEFDGKPKLNQSVPIRLPEGMLVGSSLLTKDAESKKLEASSVFANLGIEHAFHGRSTSDCLPFSGAGSSTDARNICASPNGKLWYRSMQKSASSEKRGSLSPDLPCISEENENIDEPTETLWCGNTPNSASSEKRGSSSPDLPCIAEENENADDASEGVREATYCEMKNVSAERKTLVVVDENIKFPASISEAKMHVDRQSLDSVNTSFSFTATCNSVQSKLGKQNGGKRRCTGKGKENRISRGATAAARKIDPLNNRSSKPKLSGNSSLTIQGPRLSEKGPRHNNIVSNITSFIPLVQQPKPASELITGKRDLKVKALEAAEAAKRLADKKENERKIKKEALKLERARQEEENQRKQELERQKKEERKRKEAEMAERKRQKDEEEKKLKEEERKKKEAEMAERKRQREEEEKLKEKERKKKEAEMAERKRQREEEEKKLKEAKRKRVAGAQRQKREPEAKLLAEKGEKESQTQATEAITKAQKEVKEEAGNAEKTTKEEANPGMAEVESKMSGVSEDSKNMSSSGHESKVNSNAGKMCEEVNCAAQRIEDSYDISPYKCSDDEDEDEDEDVPNTKHIPAWASKNSIVLAVSAQQDVDPEKIFPLKSFCGIGEVLLPRRLQSR